MSQVSGLGNIAVDSVYGVQLSSLFNYARYVGGGQISLFNIADTVGGTPVGLISFVRKGYHKIELSSEEILNVNFTYKMGVRKFYNIFTAGYALGADSPVWGFGYGFGSQIGKNKIVLNLDFKGTQLMEDVPDQNFNVSFRFSPTLGLRIVKGLSFFIGPALNLHVSDLHDPATGEFTSHAAPEKLLIWESVPGVNTKFQLWAGGSAGFRIF